MIAAILFTQFFVVLFSRKIGTAERGGVSVGMRRAEKRKGR